MDLLEICNFALMGIESKISKTTKEKEIDSLNKKKIFLKQLAKQLNDKRW